MFDFANEADRQRTEDHWAEIQYQHEYEAAWNELLFAAKQALMAIEEGYDAPKIRDDLRDAINKLDPS